MCTLWLFLHASNVSLNWLATAIVFVLLFVMYTSLSCSVDYVSSAMDPLFLLQMCYAVFYHCAGYVT